MSSESTLPKLEDISEIQAGLRNYLVRYWHVPEDRLDLSFRNWCKNLSEGNAFPDMRRFVIYVLLCAGYHQHQISKMLNVSLRTVGRDVKLIGDKLFMPRFWKKGLLRPGKLREKEEDPWETMEKMIEPYLKDGII